MVVKLAKEMHADGVINFCHWGCKQSAGGVFQLRETLKAADIPLLVLDGDAMDRRNSHDGQIKTRLEAFLVYRISSSPYNAAPSAPTISGSS